MSDFNVGNNFSFKKVQPKEVAIGETSGVALPADQTEDLKAQTDLSLDPSAVIGKSLVKGVGRAPKHDPVLLESLLKFLHKQPEAVAAFNDAYEVAISEGFDAMSATAFAEEALGKYIKTRVDASIYTAPDDFPQ